MFRRVICILIVFCSLAASSAQDKPQVKDETGRWEKTIRVFEEWDRKNSFAKGAVLFVGSSSIRLWRTRECFGEFEVINRGFGGSQISDVNYFAKRIVLCYKPKVIVFYAGDNDVAEGKSAKRVFDDYMNFIKLIHNKLPKTRIIFISIKPSRSRWSLWNVMNAANMMIKAFSMTDARLFYFDGATPLLDNDGEPNAELFLEDKLHLNNKGYEVWTKLLTPVIKEAFCASDTSNVATRRANSVSGADTAALEDAVRIASSAVTEQSRYPAHDYVLVSAQQIVGKDRFIWRVTFKPARLLPEDPSKEAIGAGGQIFVNVDLNTGKSELRYGE